MKKLLARLRIDPFTLALLCTVTLASLLPVTGTAAASTMRRVGENS